VVCQSSFSFPREKIADESGNGSFDAGEYGVQVANAICDKADVLLLSPRDRVEPYASKLNPKSSPTSSTCPASVSAATDAGDVQVAPCDRSLSGPT
jgi:hypothetical protein